MFTECFLAFGYLWKLQNGRTWCLWKLDSVCIMVLFKYLFLMLLDYSILTSFTCNWIILQVATGDGMAIAHRAQAVISNME